MAGHRSGSRRMFARSVTVLAGGRAGNVKPCVPKWRFRASATRRGSAERPTNNSPRPYAESDLDTMNRYAVFPDASRRRQHRRTPSQYQRATVAGWTSTNASLHRGHNHRNNSQSRRSVGRQRGCERARTPSWWRGARVSSRRSIRVAWDAWAVAAVLKPPRNACRVPGGDAEVSGFCRTGY